MASTTHIGTGEDYDTLSLAEVFEMQPWARDKRRSPACIPSSYNGHDAREHARQRAAGSFVALCGDVDRGNHAIETITAAVERVCGASAWLVYSSPHARDDDMRWRIIIPLSAAAPHDDWRDAQDAFFDLMERAGIQMDRAMNRAAQPVYLPNVPAVHAKTGTPLRSEDGKPIYYRTAASDVGAPGLSLDGGPLTDSIIAIRDKRAQDDAARERLRIAAEQRRANRPLGGDASLIDDLNASTSLADMLALCGYEQSRRDERDWRSPHQTGDTYATRVMDDKWVSLSGSDAAAGVGANCEAGCYGDAYDLFAHYEHRGDHRAAFRQLGAERRASQPNVIRADFRAAPPEIDGDPGWLAMPDQMHGDSDEGQPAGDRTPPAEWPALDLTACALAKAPAREWVVDGMVPVNKATLLAGDGGVGKSLAAQQLAACTALGRPFLGIQTRAGVAAYVSWEDDADELWRRQEAICATMGIRMADLAGRLHLVSYTETENPFLVSSDDDHGIKVAPLGRDLEQICERHQVGLLILDNASQIAGIDHNAVDQVAPFAHWLGTLAKRQSGALMLLHHTNKAGQDYLGSVAYNNQFRSRLLLARPPSEECQDPDARVLSNPKANYAQAGNSVEFRWHRGAFVLNGDLPDDTRERLAATIATTAANGSFLDCLRARASQGQGRQVGPSPGPNYAPSQFEGMPQAKGLSSKQLKAAMDRLFTIGAIKTHTYRNTAKGRDVTVIREPAQAPRTPTPNASRTLPERTPDPVPNAALTTPHTHSPLKGGRAGAPEGAPPSPNTFSNQTSGAGGGPILAPGQTLDDPVPGWEDLH